MCCKKNTIVFFTKVAIVLNVFLLVKCGRFKRVVGAMPVECGMQPYVASLRNSSNLQHICGAIIVSPEYALTVAHCAPCCEDQYILQLNNYCVDENDTPPRADVLDIVTHPLYNPITRAHDVAVLRVTLHVDDVTWLNRTLLPTSSFGISGECTIYGYGYNAVDTKETSAQLLAGTLRIVSLDECMETLGPYVAPDHDNGMMCAVGDGVDACQGDSGSPLICSEGTVEGLSSYGMSCAVAGIPGVYTSIGAHLPWITAVMQNK